MCIYVVNIQERKKSEFKIPEKNLRYETLYKRAAISEKHDGKQNV